MPRKPAAQEQEHSAEPRQSLFDGLPPEVREAMELAFVHAVADALEREAAELKASQDHGSNPVT